MVTIRNYRDLVIWQEAMDLCAEIYQITQEFPKDEQYNLVSQIRRAGVSVPSNIAEGFGRKHGREFKQFLSVSVGSLNEIETQILLSERLGYITEDVVAKLLEKSQQLGRRIINFSQGVRTR